jgi:radical SAM superfamily enzyme YgiQ (UPF0313 family)
MSKRLLLISPAHQVNGSIRRGPGQFPIPPLNLGYVAALTPADWQIRIIDEQLGLDDGLEWGPDLVGLTALTPSAPRAYALAARHRAQGTTVVMGGVHATAMPDEAARHVDAVVTGDAEGVWPQLVADFVSRSLQSRYDGEFLPLDNLVQPRRDLYPKGYPTETIISSKGCPYHCEFCSIWRYYDRRYRPRPIEAVVDELAGLSDRKLIFFADDNITIDQRRCIELCRLMVERGVRRRYAIQGSLNLADNEELLNWLKRSGCIYVFIGFESLNPQTLTLIDKPDLLRLGPDGYKRRIKRIHDHGLAVFGSFIVGFDHDTPDVFERLRNFILEAEIDCALINILNACPGTDLWERLFSQGRLLYSDWPDEYVYLTQDNVSIMPTAMSPLELQVGAKKLIADLTSHCQVLKRGLRTWRYAGDPVAGLVALVWNYRSGRALRSYPLQDVRNVVLSEPDASVASAFQGL